MGSFSARTRELQDRVGRGTLEGKVNFDQVYAAVQHEGYWLTGPNAGIFIRHYTTPGTGTKYLEGPLLEGADEMVGKLAHDALQPEGLNRAMVANVEDLSAKASLRAPRLVGDLANSAHPTVTSDGALVYDRAPAVGRKSEAELRAKAKLTGRHGYRR